jgi:hypothetical protein
MTGMEWVALGIGAAIMVTIVALFWGLARP